jgi:hypothetical protein
MVQKWYQSWVVISTTIVSIVGLLSTAGGWDLLGSDNASIEKWVGLAIAIISQIFAALNNPYNKTGYGANE